MRHLKKVLIALVLVAVTAPAASACGGGPLAKARFRPQRRPAARLLSRVNHHRPRLLKRSVDFVFNR